jgi:hypothetical protein
LQQSNASLMVFVSSNLGDTDNLSKLTPPC